MYSENFYSNIFFMLQLPSQELPFPVYPSLHMHANDPSVLLQKALESHRALLLAHSLRSGMEISRYVYMRGHNILTIYMNC